MLGLCLPRLAAVASAAWNRDGETDFGSFAARQTRLVPRLEKISGFRLPQLPFAVAETQGDNVASAGASRLLPAPANPSTGQDSPTASPIASITSSVSRRNPNPWRS